MKIIAIFIFFSLVQSSFAINTEGRFQGTLVATSVKSYGYSKELKPSNFGPFQVKTSLKRQGNKLKVNFIDPYLTPRIFGFNSRKQEAFSECSYGEEIGGVECERVCYGIALTQKNNSTFKIYLGMNIFNCANSSNGLHLSYDGELKRR